MTVSATRRWVPPFVPDVGRVLGPLRRGLGDPTFRAEPGEWWLAGNTPAGVGTLHLRGRDGAVEASAWGDGADWLLERVPALLGADDDDTGFVAHHDLIADIRRRLPKLRLGATGRVWDVLVAAILEQKVTGHEARRSWRELARRFGTPAPGPAPTGMYAPPTPQALLTIADWEWHKAGVDGARRRTLVRAAGSARGLERAAEVRGEKGRDLLRVLPGIGIWTAAEVAQRAWGDADAVSVGDFHIPSVVGHALLGRPLDDDGMMAELAPYLPQRQRAVRYIEAAGIRRPRFAPRFSPRDYRRL
jgi:3-methyladenine DNA glycosylase/8-oxoguanine DNA glycosylase